MKRSLPVLEDYRDTSLDTPERIALRPYVHVPEKRRPIQRQTTELPLLPLVLAMASGAVWALLIRGIVAGGW